MLKPHETVADVWLLSPNGRFDRPHVGVVGSLHGNEPAGHRVIQRIVAEPEQAAARLSEGTLVLVHGNPEASRQNRRFTEGGVDINRLFSYAYADRVAPEAWAYEHHRALALRPVLEGLDAMIDLHSATQPTPAFSICDRRSAALDLGAQLGVPVTCGWDGPGMLMEDVVIGDLVARGLPALGVECGQHDDPESPERAWQSLWRFLAALNLAEVSPVPGSPVYELFARIVKPTVGFNLVREFTGFDRLQAGETLGRGDGVAVTVERETVLVLPTPTAGRGDDLVFLAHQLR